MLRSTHHASRHPNPSRWLLLLVPALLCNSAIPIHAQQPNRIELAIAYDTAHAKAANGGSFWLQGGSAALTGRIYGPLSMAADFTGLHTANTGVGLPLNLFTVTFGPRLTWTTHSRHPLVFFAEALAGQAYAGASLFPTPYGANTRAISLAVQAGGGIDIGLSRHLALRPIEAHWLRTQLPNSTTNAQNNLQLGAAIVFHPGSR